MTAKIPVIFNEAEFEALYQVAKSELRSPAAQVRIIIRQDLERRGLLAATRRAAGRDTGPGEQATNDSN